LHPTHLKKIKLTLAASAYSLPPAADFMRRPPKDCNLTVIYKAYIFGSKKCTTYGGTTAALTVVFLRHVVTILQLFSFTRDEPFSNLYWCTAGLPPIFSFPE
jgi:hypothetical protein